MATFGVSVASGKSATDLWKPGFDYLNQHPPKYKKILRTSRYLVMRDGVKIAIDVNLPEGLPEEEKIPAIIRQTRYYRSHDLGRMLRFLTRNWPSPEKVFVPRGYAWVDVDVRGTGASFGRWAYPWSPDEVRDGGEVVDWIVSQSWSNGQVGTMGISYDGGTAEFLLANERSAVKASAPEFTLFDAYADITYPGGINLISFTNAWAHLNKALDNANLTTFTSMMPGFLRSSYHGVRPVDSDRDRSMLAQAIQEHAGNLDINAMVPKITFRDDVPSPPGVAIDASSPFAHAAEISESGATVYMVEGWFDAAFVNGAISRYLTLSSRDSKDAASNHQALGKPVLRDQTSDDPPPSSTVKIIIGPWNHGGWQDASPFNHFFGSSFSLDAELLRFFDERLKGVSSGVMPEKSIRYFTMGEEKWKDTDEWPPSGTRAVSYYLGGDHRLSTDEPMAVEASDGYRVDLTAGTGPTSRWDLGAPVIYPDRRVADKKLLCYTSPPLEQDLEVTGNPVVDLFVASTATDGEFFAYLEDVGPKGKVEYVTEGELRAIHRKLSTEQPPYRHIGPYHSFRRRDAMPLKPGVVTDLTFEILPTSYLFKRGHSIRLALAGADKDHFAILPGLPPTLRLYRDHAHTSRIDLPVTTR